ncbi:hypothetical protein AVEN_139552-1 [Araneus ventricosus]|uniref:Uncharacterized protein n=1 Tax=Araneus ventricosus TaxID=182803 RepID=A0A4Y2PUB1_ARAVE|nr:hypothetical protein AVEN_139552-1 [Araneus ventricosus]
MLKRRSWCPLLMQILLENDMCTCRVITFSVPPQSSILREGIQVLEIQNLVMLPSYGPDAHNASETSRGRSLSMMTNVLVRGRSL